MKIRVVLVGAILCLLLANYHGFSTGFWHEILGHQDSPETLLFRNQAIRSDDACVNFPAISSSRFTQNTNHIPYVNPFLGYEGSSELFIPGTGVPSSHWSTFFRPHVWGYYLSNNFGLSWHWLFNVIGFFIGTYFFIRELSQLSRRNSFILSLFFILNPVFTFWSFNSAIAMSAALFAVALVIKTLRSERFYFLYALALTFVIVCFGLYLYPPYQISLAISGIVVILCWILETKTRLRLNFKLLFGLVLPLGFAAILGLFYYFEIDHVIRLIAQTSYPGTRSSFGGDVSIYTLFSSFFASSFYKYQWPTNSSEAAGFYFFSVFLIPSYILQKVRTQRSFTPMILGASALFLFYVFYALFGIPNYLASVTGLKMVPAHRLGPALAFLDLSLSAWILAKSGTLEYLKKFPKDLYFVVCAILVFFFLLSLRISSFAPSLNLVESFWMPVVLTSLFVAIVHNKKLIGFVLGTILFIPSFEFNPVNFGGGDLLDKSPVTLMLRSHVNPDSRGMVFGGGMISNFPRAIGLKSIGGTQYYPQLSLWQILDPQTSFYDSYNRYGHLFFYFASSPKENDILISNPSPDRISVQIHPDNPRLKQLGIRWILSKKENEQLLNSSKYFRLVDSTDSYVLFLRRDE